MIQVIYVCPFYNLKTVSEIFLKPCKNVKGHVEHFIFDELWHLLDVRAVVGHGAVLAVLLFLFFFFVELKYQQTTLCNIFFGFA